jgi:hypothetical protein
VRDLCLYPGPAQAEPTKGKKMTSPDWFRDMMPSSAPYPGWHNPDIYIQQIKGTSLLMV